MIALIGMILALVFVIVALVGPWYGISIKLTLGTAEIKSDATMSLTATTLSVTTPLGSNTTTTSYADTREQAKATGTDTGILDIFNIAMYFTIFALIVAILALVFLSGYTFNFGKPHMMKNLAMVFGIITFIIVLAAVFYFMVAVPSQLKASDSNLQNVEDFGFWYSKSESGNSVSLGPGFAWYLMIVAGIIALISSLFIFMDKTAAPVYQNPAP